MTEEKTEQSNGRETEVGLDGGRSCAKSEGSLDVSGSGQREGRSEEPRGGLQGRSETAEERLQRRLTAAKQRDWPSGERTRWVKRPDGSFDERVEVFPKRADGTLALYPWGDNRHHSKNWAHGDPPEWMMPMSPAAALETHQRINALLLKIGTVALDLDQLVNSMNECALLMMKTMRPDELWKAMRMLKDAQYRLLQFERSNTEREKIELSRERMESREKRLMLGLREKVRNRQVKEWFDTTKADKAKMAAAQVRENWIKTHTPDEALPKFLQGQEPPEITPDVFDTAPAKRSKRLP